MSPRARLRMLGAGDAAEVTRMEQMIPTRMGDGSLVEMARSEIRTDLEEGTQFAAKKAKVPELTQDELDHLLDIYASPARFTAVDIGDEVVLSNDGTGTKYTGSVGMDLQVYEQVVGVDIVELWQTDYSYKAVKTNVHHEAQWMKMAQLLVTNPVQYGAMPDLGRYSAPDGPYPNWSELLPLGRIDEARGSQEAAAAALVHDIEFVADHLVAAGADGIDMDTTGAAGDCDFLAALQACERLRARYPDLGIEIGMAGEFVIGMHGQVTHNGTRLAGLWPKAQLELVQKAGASIFGPCVNINTGKSTAWNIARAVTIIKPCMEIAEIPVHVNVGMGVGAVPTCAYPPADATSRASKAFVEVLRVDGY
jgi:dimethylamine--corrinoid protein Co-methyltransferase